jgi:hypothetical protein
MQFKLDLVADQWVFHLTNQTDQQSGFHIANMMTEQGGGEAIQGTVDAIAQLATARASYSGMIAKLTATNAGSSPNLDQGTEG